VKRAEKEKGNLICRGMFNYKLRDGTRKKKAWAKGRRSGPLKGKTGLNQLGTRLILSGKNVTKKFYTRTMQPLYPCPRGGYAPPFFRVCHVVELGEGCGQKKTFLERNQKGFVCPQLRYWRGRGNWGEPEEELTGAEILREEGGTEGEGLGKDELFFPQNHPRRSGREKAGGTCGLKMQ